MPHELIFTSAVRGLVLGTDGYCVVAETPGLPRPLRSQLERLSGYRHRVKGRRPDLTNNPVAVSHQMLTAGGQRYHVLSRIADAGFDHTDRTNFLAHHLAFTADELPSAGLAWLALQPGVFRTDWLSTRPPEELPAGRRLPDGNAPARKCEGWGEITGDAGWAGVLAASQSAPVAVLYKPGQPVLELIAEATALVSEDRRARVTFTTYDTGATECLWRFMLADSPEAAAAAKTGGPLLRLDRRMSGTPTGPLVAAARTGVLLSSPPTAARTHAVLNEPSLEPIERKRRGRYEEDDDEDDTPAVTPARGRSRYDEADNTAIPTAARSGSPLKPMLIGLALGLALAFVFSTLVELGGGKSLLQVVGNKTAPEKALETERDAFKTQLETAQAEKSKLDTQFGKDSIERKRQLDEALDRARKAEKEKKDINQELTGLKKEKKQWEEAKKLEKDTGQETKDLKAKIKTLEMQLADMRKSNEDLTAKLNKAKKPKPKAKDAKLEVLDLKPGEAKKVAEPNTKATITIAAGAIHYLPGSGKAELTRFKDMEKAYQQNSGMFTVPKLEPNAVPVLWSDAVIKVTEEAGDKRYYQLAKPAEWPGGMEPTNTPGQYTLNMLPLVHEKLKTWPEGLAFGFQGSCKIQVGKNLYELKGSGPNTPSDKVETDRIKMIMTPSGKIQIDITLPEVVNNKNALPVVITDAKIVRKEVIEELMDQQPVIARIHGMPNDKKQ